MSTGSSADGSASRRLTSRRAGVSSALAPKRTVSSKSSYFFVGVTGASGVVNPGTDGEPTGAPGMVTGVVGAGAPPALPPPAGAVVGASGFGVGVGVAFGLNGSFGEPRTWRRWARSPSLAGTTIGSVVRVDSSDFTP